MVTNNFSDMIYAEQVGLSHNASEFYVEDAWFEFQLDTSYPNWEFCGVSQSLQADVVNEVLHTDNLPEAACADMLKNISWNEGCLH